MRPIGKFPPVPESRYPPRGPAGSLMAMLTTPATLLCLALLPAAVPATPVPATVSAVAEPSAFALQGQTTVVEFFDMLRAGDVDEAMKLSIGPTDANRRSLLEAWSASGRAHAALAAAVEEAHGEPLAWPTYALPAAESVGLAVNAGRGVMSVNVASMPEPLLVFKLRTYRIDLTSRLVALAGSGELEPLTARHHAAAAAFDEARRKLEAGEFADAEAVRVQLDETVPLEGEAATPTTRPAGE